MSFQPAQEARLVICGRREPLEFHRTELVPRWTLASSIEQLGPRTFRADWTAGDHRLRISATREDKVDPEVDASIEEAVVQYSLSLGQL